MRWRWADATHALNTSARTSVLMVLSGRCRLATWHSLSVRSRVQGGSEENIVHMLHHEIIEDDQGDRAEGRMKSGKSVLHETLKRQILTLELEPDHDLDEVQLSLEYKISRTPVRDVLRRLAGEGYVEIRENRGARVIPMNHTTLRDFFLVAPLIYEAVGRLAVQNFRSVQMEQLRRCQDRFRAAIAASNPEAMVVENDVFHATVGDMAHSAFLKPSLNKLLIDHARIGHTFFRPRDDAMRVNLATACEHHDQFIAAIGARDEATVVRLVHDHWELSRRNMEMFVAPEALRSTSMQRLSPASSPRRSRTAKASGEAERKLS